MSKKMTFRQRSITVWALLAIKLVAILRLIIHVLLILCVAIPMLISTDTCKHWWHEIKN